MLFISDVLIGELVVLLLLLMVTLRPLFKKNKYADSFAVLVVLAFFVAMLQLFIFGASVFLVLIVSISLLVLLTNVRALQRFAKGLYVDRYSIPFHIASYIEAICIVLCIALCVLFQPEPINKNLRDTQVYFGSFSRGFTEKKDLFKPVNLILTEYSIEGTEVNSERSEFEPPVVVFLNDIGTTVDDSALRLSLAAERGMNIIVGDFYTDDMPKKGINLDSSFFSSHLMKSMTLHFLPPIDTVAEEAFLKQKELELDELLILARKRASSVVIVAEGLAKQAALNAQRKYPDFVVSVFDATEDMELKEYYGRGIADLTFTSPIDALFSSFEGFSGYMEYKEFREFAQRENPALRFAELLSEHVQDMTKGGM